MRELLQRLAPGLARIVDEDVELRRARLYLGSQRHHAGLRPHIAGETFRRATGIERIQLPRHDLARLALA
jgi:hypothetical protein